eukprot:CAMPEP_0119029758 /NCGR_PEP_ID=MMETSP1176-20130426/40684_1 /TAXON_ID=265551 /ORGANISM="Synedropsis recta cf, Strain CCMP1620" /LENGTH=297 /DNA_ID=CAMNT_0006986113 /DNA_START=87 /DNA_END=981 /DNA_ORIENTATION=-
MASTVTTRSLLRHSVLRGTACQHYHQQRCAAAAMRSSSSSSSCWNSVVVDDDDDAVDDADDDDVDDDVDDDDNDITSTKNKNKNNKNRPDAVDDDDVDDDDDDVDDDITSTKNKNKNNKNRPAWSDEWKAAGLGAQLIDDDTSQIIDGNLLFVQMGFGVDQHGDDATKAATRAVRNAIEFNSIPGVMKAIPGGRKEMLIHVKLGIPAIDDDDDDDSLCRVKKKTMPIDVLQVAKVFPYGKLLPIDVVVGGLSFPTGRVVPELGDDNDLAVCVAACVSIGYNSKSSSSSSGDDDDDSS